MLEVKQRQQGFKFMSSHNHAAYHITYHRDDTSFLYPCFFSVFNPTQVLSSETTMAFDMEIKLLIWSYILLLRDFTPLHDYSVVTSNR